MGLYVDDFIYFSNNTAVEEKFERILSRLINVDFMGTVEWFLGTHFSWRQTSEETAVHMNQSGFSRNLVERYDLQDRNVTPVCTPYRSGIPIDSIKGGDSSEEQTPAQQRRTQSYQSLVGSIGWLSNITRPDMATCHSFLSSYTMCPTVGHMKAALHALHYIHSTHNYGIVFTSKDKQPIHTFLHHPHKSDLEAFDDAVPPSHGEAHRMTTYTDANWGSQIGNAIREGTPLPLFKFRSMSGAIVFRMSGPLAWKTERQEKTSLSSCEAEIKATCMGSKLTVATRNFSEGFKSCGVPAPTDTDTATTLYNDNQSAVFWAHNMTLKAVRHMEFKENAVREWVKDNTLKVLHVIGKDNVSDIFTKEIRDAPHFCRLRDSFMCRLTDFDNETRAIHFRQSNVKAAAAPAQRLWC
jgi:hypothetical protein